MQVCANCGEHNSERARFCQACAAPLPGSTPASEVRKTVTVVFADLVGSTALGETLDPEALREVLNRYFAEMRAALERHGGVVEKYIGDAVMAVFGLPQVHEDDAMRAVRAAREMQRRLAAVNDDLEREYGVRLTNRTGVHTGEVVAGDPALGQRLVTGDAVNVAARLEQAAPPGEVLLGDPTYRLVRGSGVRTEPVEPLALKGKSQRVPAYRLLEVADATSLGRRSDTPLVGRTQELDRLLRSFDTAASSRTRRLVTVIGDPGVGKSRLVAEFVSLIEGQATVLRGVCLSYGEGITYWPLAEAVRGAASIIDADTQEEAVAKVRGLLESAEQGDMLAERLAGAIGLSPASFPDQETFWATRRLFDHMAETRPVVVVFDDIHWAEPAFLDLIRHVAGHATAAPVVVVCTARHELIEGHPEWGKGVPEGVTVSLGPLSEEESRELTHALLATPGVPDELLARVSSAAQGNPLFVEQMLALWVETGAIRKTPSGWGLGEDPSQLVVPPSISALLASRLDRLVGRERAVIERASVVGQVFTRPGVEALSPQEERSHLGADLLTLANRQLVGPETTTSSEEETYRFLHALIKDSAYGGMLKRTRADLHERFATWLETAFAGRLPEVEEIVAYHLEQAHRNLAELGPLGERGRAIGRRAAERLVRLARNARRRGDQDGVARGYERALAVLTGDPSRTELIPDAADATLLAGRSEEALALADQALKETGGVGAIALRAELLRLRAAAATDPSASVAALRDGARRLIERFEVLNDERGLAEGWIFVGEMEGMLGRLGPSTEAYRTGAEHASAAGLDEEASFTLMMLPLNAAQGPTPVPEGIVLARQALDGAGDLLSQGAAYHALSWLLAMAGRFEEARSTVAEYVQLRAELGLPFGGRSSEASATVERLAGDLSAAEEALWKGYDWFESRGETGLLSTWAGWLAEPAYARGDLDEAERLSKLSEELAAPDDLLSQVLWRGARSKVLARRGSAGSAERLAREAVALVAQTDMLSLHGDALMVLFDVLRMNGDVEGAKNSAQAALDLYDQKGNIASAGRARGELAALNGLSDA